jgi:hypothetical protein
MRDDQLAADYLKRLRRAARTMPRARRRELLDEIAAHIAEARAAGGVPLRRVLDDLGDPKDIAATGRAGSRLGVREITAVVLLLIGGFIFLAGWVVGVVLLWTSPRWRWPDKLLGTLVWPGGLAAVVPFSIIGAQFTSSDSSWVMPQWLSVFILVADVVAPIAVAIWLVLRARRMPDQAERPISEPART